MLREVLRGFRKVVPLADGIATGAAESRSEAELSVASTAPSLPESWYCCPRHAADVSLTELLLRTLLLTTAGGGSERTLLLARAGRLVGDFDLGGSTMQRMVAAVWKSFRWR